MQTTLLESAGSMRIGETGGDGHVRAVALVLHARHLALEVAEVGGELGDACLRGAELRALAVAEVAAALAGSLLKLFHHRAEVRHLLLGEGERGDRVAHGGGGLLEHHLRRGRLRAERLLRAPHSLVEVFLGYLRGREGRGERQGDFPMPKRPRRGKAQTVSRRPGDAPCHP